MSSPYQYSPLDSPDHIRLLHVKPGTEDEPVACEVRHVTLTDSPVYKALSYTWDIDEPTGEPLQSHLIACGEFQIFVAPNLFSTIRRFRILEGDLVLWVDAVCINQADNQERGHQVGIMHSIYATCTRVLVWLGEEQPGDSIAFNLARKLSFCSSTIPEDSPERKNGYIPRKTHQNGEPLRLY
jgi:Heterokaryon incompatibility protein (HET)